MSDFGEIVVGIAVISIFTALLSVVYFRRRASVLQSLSSLENPPEMETTLPLSDAYKKIRHILKQESFHSYKWTIKEDNPKGMLIAILTFEEDLGNQSAVAKRQLILTVSVQADEKDEETGCIVRLVYSVYAPFGRSTCDAVLNETTDAIGKVLEEK